MAKSGIKSGLRSARKQHIINNNNNNNNEATIAPRTIETEVKIKQEPANEEFKEFAETAMNELLGWYGYGSSAPRDSVGGGSGAEMARPSSYKSNSNSNSSSPVSPLHANGCGWCGKTVDENNGLLSGQSSFCSELCFSHSRRANFKKNKTCDWCRHVRHTVSYVDFQEGPAQLQFCSDKCLNQYKMHIFCRETQAHLDFHPHLIPTAAGGAGAASGSGGAALITPELWLRDCKTPPEEDAMDDVEDSIMKEEEGPLDVRDKQDQTSMDKVPKLIPIITLAPTSSLLASSSSNSSKRIAIVKKTRNKRKRFSSATNTSSLNTPNLNLIEEVAQDLRVRHNITPPVQKIPNLQELHKKSTSFNNTSSLQATVEVNNSSASSSDEVHRVPFQSTCANNFSVPNRTHIPAETTQNSTPEQTKSSPNVSLLPPVTVLVPYPIMIPVPVPIPIPLPISSFLTAYFGTKAAADVQEQLASRSECKPVSTADKHATGTSPIDGDGRPEVASSTSGICEQDVVVDDVGDEPKSPRMLRRRCLKRKGVVRK